MLDSATGADTCISSFFPDTLVSVTCTGEGASCPSPLGLSMLVPKLPKGSALHFVVTVKLADIPTGTIVNGLVASYDQDPDPNTNSVSLDALVR